MSRKSFIESHGATCRNWTWSWSFVNDEKKFIIFGAWDIFEEGNRSLIISEDWEYNAQRRRNPGYEQSREHIRLIEEEGYELKTFSMEYAKADKNDPDGPGKIKSFSRELAPKFLLRVGRNWYACDNGETNRIAEEISDNETFVEGARTSIQINAYERNGRAREACLNHHGRNCAVCQFNFSEKYGELGDGYIHVHHIIPIAEIGAQYKIDPFNDLVPICPNCHAMIHTTRPALTVEQLKQQISKVMTDSPNNTVDSDT